MTTPEWSKSVWALARMENLLGNSTAALSLWQTAYSQPTVPIRFRIQAQFAVAEDASCPRQQPSNRSGTGSDYRSNFL